MTIRKCGGKIVSMRTIGYLLLLCIAGMMLHWLGVNARMSAMQPEIADKVLRFHILANSDSKEDQQIKLAVRDTVGAYVQGLLEDSKNLGMTEHLVSEHLDEISGVATERLEELGSPYGARAELEYVDFPVKTYGDYTFPAGRYEALRVILGEGGGHNWWCVLYPNMCFRGSLYEVIDEKSKVELRKVLTTEEYAELIQKKKCKIKWKFLEYLREKGYDVRYDR